MIAAKQDFNKQANRMFLLTGERNLKHKIRSVLNYETNGILFKFQSFLGQAENFSTPPPKINLMKNRKMIIVLLSLK